MNELKPCPFCGATLAENVPPHNGTEITHDAIANGEIDRYTVTCWTCLFDGPPAPTIEKATELWNQRTYDYDMPGIAKKIEALQLENEQLKQAILRLHDATQHMARLLYSDGEHDTNGFTVAALVSALQQYARRENWTQDAYIRYEIGDEVEDGTVRLDKAIVWKCGSPGYLLAERALNGDVSESEGS